MTDRGGAGIERRDDVPALEARGVTKRFGDVTALRDVDLAVSPGECVALVGESGSGKSTLLRCFNRLVEPDAGEIRVGGRPARELDPIRLRRHTGYVQQDGGLLPHWRVRRNVELVPRLLLRADAAERAEAALRVVGLDASVFAERWPRALSGGQRQRVALARALAAEPAVVLLDEPFGALDAITRAELQQTFEELRLRLRVTAVLVTHDLHEALRLADRVAVLRGGVVEQVAAGPELVRAPASDYVRRLLNQARVAA